MRLARALVAVFLLLSAPAGADPLSAAKRLVIGGVPGWVLRAGGIPATIDLNFATGQSYGCSLASCLSITRASAKTNLLPSSASGFAYTTFGNNVLAIDNNGVLIEESRINQLFNSTAPATQTTGSLANGTYTLWVNGSGTATMSAGTATGCGTGVASQGTPVNFTTSGAAGTCTVTVAGSLNAFQLELGGSGTSLIVTAAATATRAADNISGLGRLNAVGIASVGTIYTETGVLTSVSGPPDIVNQNNAGLHLVQVDTATTVRARATTNVIATLGTGSFTSSTVKSAVSWNGTAVSVVGNNGTVATGNVSVAFGGTTLQFGANSSGSVQNINGYIRRLALWSFRTSDPTLKVLTQ